MKKHTKGRRITHGTTGGVVASVALHAAAFLLAGLLVVFEVFDKPEQKFVPPEVAERPKMKLRKPKVKVRPAAPKPTRRIVTKIQRTQMPRIELPEMSGMEEGLTGSFEGFELAADLGSASVFGSVHTIGNDFEGVLYDLKRDRRGGLVPMNRDQFRQVLRSFVLDGWDESELARYYRSPQKLYTTHFMIPPIVAPVAPDVFGAPETESYYFFVKYKGQLVHKEDIRFRFWGIGDAYIFVRVDGREVLLNCWDFHEVYFDWWQSTSVDSQKYYLANQTMQVGDWIELEGGKPVEMEVLFGEWVGGVVAAMLLVEVEGKEYPQTRQGGPLLPAFKTQEFTLDQREEIVKYLPEGECSLTNGPVFNDF